MTPVGTPYEIVVGLEVHSRLLTKSKLFCGDSTLFGGDPNTHISPITLAHPGTLPKMNRKAVEFAVKMGLACGCNIAKENYFARKNYFYPDLPKGYQVSQHTTPICEGGFIHVTTSTGEKHIRLNRIHMEEDAGRSQHDSDDPWTMVDYNRAGTALIEIVTEPDIRSAEEAFACLTEIRKRVRYLGIGDGNMEEGSLRCDANISVRKKGDPKLGTKVEIKNLNSISNVKRAVETESARLIEMLENGQTIKQETRSFDASTGTSFPTREKEDADDYRYFAEPDLTPFHLTENFIEDIRAALPAMPEQRVRLYQEKFMLPAYDAAVISEEIEQADYFEAIAAISPYYKSAANWIMGPVRSWLNDGGHDFSEFPLTPETMASLIKMVEEKAISFTTASGKLFPALLENPAADPAALAIASNWLQESDAGLLETLVDQVLNKFPDKVKEYQKGKKGLLSLFTGEVMKLSKGKADPVKTNEILLEKLKS